MGFGVVMFGSDLLVLYCYVWHCDVGLDILMLVDVMFCRVWLYFLNGVACESLR